MSAKLSSRILPELEVGLREAGLLTTLVTIESQRFRHYLKKPANLLHDGWSFVESADGKSVTYRLGEEQGARQELRICRTSKTAILRTYQPRAGRTQNITFDFATKSIVENCVVHQSNGLEVHHRFLFVNRREGRLTRSSVAEMAA